MKHITSKLLSLLLCLAMLMSMAPVAYATVDGESTGGEKASTETNGGASEQDDTTTNAAKVGEEVYTTLATALDKAQDDDTVTLLADVTEDVTINKSITLDLGGKTLTNTSAGKATISVTGGTVTVKNGSVKGGKSYYNIEVTKGSNADLTLENVTATAGNTGSSMIDNYGDLTINSGDYTGGLNVVKSEEGSTLTINGGKFTLDYAPSSGYTATILVYGDTTITGGEFIQNAKPKWGSPQVVMTGVVEGYTAITKITGGTFTNKKSGDNIFHGLGKATSDNFEVSGGNFNKSVSSGYLKDGFVCKKNTTTGMYELTTGATGVTLSESEKTIKVGEKFKLEATLTPEDAELKSVEWKSSDKKIADVNKHTGTVKGVAIGDVTITATPNAAGAIPATCTVHVYDEVAQIGETKYSTFEDALKAAKENEAITLLKNISLKTTVEISKSVTLDLGGFTVTGPNVKSGQSNEYIALKVTDGTVTIKNGTVSGRVNVYDAANVTIEKDVTIQNRCYKSSSGYGVVVWGDGTYGQVGCKTPILNIYGKVNVTGNNGVAISTNGTDKSKPIINVYDGAEITSAKCSGIYLPSGALTVSGGTITGATGIYFKSTDMTISGGKIIGNGAMADYEFNGNGANTTGDALVIDNCNYPNGIDNVEVTGGNFASMNAKAVGSYAGNGQTEPLVGFITGGTFSSNPSAYVPATHHVEDSFNGSYPFAVKEGAKSDATFIVTAETNATVSNTIKDEDKTKIEEVKDKANVEGMPAAIRDDKKAAIAKAAGVTDADISDTSKTIVAEIKVNVSVTKADLTAGTMTFEASPVATVKVDGTEQTKTVPVTNDMLNGNAITVKLPLPTGFNPEQIKHISSDGSVEYFLKTAKRGANTFEIKGGCAVFTITKFSTFELSGTITYVEPSYSGGSSSDPTYSVSTPSKTENGSVTVSPKSASKGDTVTVTVKPDSGYVLETLTVTDKNGNELKLTDKGNGKYTFTMPAGKVEVKATFMEDNSVLNFFYDVPNNAYFYEAVKWAVKNGITDGVGDNLFAPGQPCTRAQIVTFLWRAAGSPEPKGAASGMSDVVSGSYYEKAVAWAIENGVTTGTTTSTFSPDATCTRAQSVTFLYRALGKKVESSANFTDVKSDAFYTDAVNWAVANNVTNGTSNTTFSPNADCTRAEIVTFLYRAYQGK